MARSPALPPPQGRPALASGSGRTSRLRTAPHAGGGRAASGSRSLLSAARFVVAPALLLFAALGCGGGSGGGRPGVLLVGLDGADWSLIEPMVAAGELPHLAALQERGARARLRSIQPIISPVVWTTIATGYGPDDHGVVDFTVPDPETGDPIVITSRHRLAKAFWDLLTDAGKSVDVVGWWATWPAEEVRGRIVSDRVLSHAFYASDDVSEGLTHPADLLGRLERRFVSPEDVTLADAAAFMNVTAEEWESADVHDFNDPIGHFRHIFATMGNATAAGEILLEDPSDVVAVYLEATDTAGHMYMRYAPPDYPYATEADRARFGGTMRAFYRAADDALGRLLAQVGPDTYVMVVSDHGFLTGRERPLEARANLDYRTAALWHRLDGIFLLAGPGVRPGITLGNASIFDVLPTLLSLVDLPVAEDFRGRVLTEAFVEPPRVRSMETYRDAAWSQSRREALAAASQAVDEEMMEKLRSLGYIGASETGSLVSLRGRLALAQYHLFVGERIRAVEELRSVVADAPDFHEGQYQLGLVALQSRDLEAAERFFRAALATAPDYAPALVNLAFVQKELGRSEEAVASLETASRIDPLDPGPVVNLAILLRESGDAEGALRRLDGVLARVPGHATALIQRALTLHQMRRFEDAAQAWEAVLAIHPEDGRARGYLERARGGLDLEGEGMER